MANRKISALTAILSGDISTANDYLPIVDASVVDADKNKRVTVAELGEAILAAGLTTDVSFTGNVTQTGTTAYAYKLARSGGGDKLRLRAEAAGGGGIINAVNSAEDDLEPLNLGGEYVSIDARVSAGATAERVRIDNNGILVTDTDGGGRQSRIGHNVNGPYFQVSNNGDQWEWRNAAGDAKAALTSGGKFGLGFGAPTLDLHVSKAAAGDYVGLALVNTSDTAASHSRALVTVAGASAGDPWVRFEINNVMNWSVGIDNDDSDTFKITRSDAIEAGANTFFEITTSGVINFRNGGSAIAQIAATGCTIGDNSSDNHTINGAVVINRTGQTGLTLLSNSLTDHSVLAIGRTTADFFAAISGAAGSWDNNSAQGDMVFRMETARSFIFDTGGGTATQLKVTHTASAVNYLEVGGVATGGGPYVQANGSDTNIDLRYFTKGTGAHRFYTDHGATEQVRINHVAGAVNRVDFYGNSTGNAPTVASASGTDTNVGLRITTQGTGNISFLTDGNSREQVRIAHEASAINYLQLKGAAAGGVPSIEAAGSDANPGLAFIAKGSGRHSFYTNGGGSTAEQARISHTASAVNWVQLTGGATGNAALIRASSATDTNVALSFSGQGTGELAFYTSGFSFKQFRVLHLASAVNFVQVYGNTTGNGPVVEAAGSDSDVRLNVYSKGTGFLVLGNGTADILWNKALVALGGGAAATLGTIGGSGPATAAQNTWMRVVDTSGNAFWVPVWK